MKLFNVSQCSAALRESQFLAFSCSHFRRCRSRYSSHTRACVRNSRCSTSSTRQRTCSSTPHWPWLSSVLVPLAEGLVTEWASSQIDDELELHFLSSLLFCELRSENWLCLEGFRRSHVHHHAFGGRLASNFGSHNNRMNCFIQLWQQFQRFYLHALHPQVNFSSNEFCLINNTLSYNVGLSTYS